MIVTVNHNLNEKEQKALENYRKFINRTRGTAYQNLDELVDTLTKRYMNSLVNQMRQKKREKISKAYRHANKAKTDQVDVILGVTDDDE